MGNPHPVDVHVGKRLRFCRNMKGLNQRALGDAIGVTFQQVQKYERGMNRMGSSRLYEFSKLLSVPISYFFEGFEEVKKGKASGMAESSGLGFDHEVLEDKALNKETADLIRVFSSAPKEKRKRILEIAKLIVKD